MQSALTVAEMQLLHVLEHHRCFHSALHDIGTCTRMYKNVIIMHVHIQVHYYVCVATNSKDEATHKYLYLLYFSHGTSTKSTLTVISVGQMKTVVEHSNGTIQ